MKDERNKIKEPYNPEDTPSPPQIIDPSSRRERGENDEPIENQPKLKHGADGQKQQKKEGNKENKKSPGNPAADIKK